MKKLFVYCLVFCVLVVFLIAGAWCYRSCSGEVVRVDTVTVVRVDSFWARDTIYRVVSEDIIRYVPVPGDTIWREDTFFVSRVDSIPIVQKEYVGDDYRAWVSGYEPSLDSIDVKKEVITNEVTITKEVFRKSSRFRFGVTGGLGYGLKGGTDVFVGLGLTYSLF